MHPTVVCPKCHARIELSTVTDQPKCQTCGPFNPTDADFRWRAFGRSTESLLAPQPRGGPTAHLARCLVDGAAVIELRGDDIGANDVGETLDASAGAAIAAIVPVLLDAARLHQVGGLVALHVAPEVARKIAAGSAHFMASDGQSLATVVGPGGKILAQARWTPAALGAVGLGAAWQVLSIAVAQKHLHDINVRLDRIEKRVDEILRELDEQVQDELRAGATALRLIAGAVTAHQPSEEARRDHKVNVRHHLDRARERHETLIRRAREHGDAWPVETARIFGQNLTSAGNKLTARAREFHRRLMAVYANILVETVALRLLLVLGEDSTFVDAALDRARQNVADADALARRFDTELAGALPAMSGIFAGAQTNAGVRSKVAFAHWQAVKHQASATAPLRLMMDEFDAPQLCAALGPDGEVGEVRLLRSRAARLLA